MDVTLDIFQGAQLDASTSSRYLRQAIVENITAADTGNDITDFMFKVQEAIVAAANATPLSPTRSGMFLRRVVLTAITDISVSAVLIYESFTGGGPPSTYLLSDDTTLTTYQTYTMPDTYEEIKVGWDSSSLPEPQKTEAGEKIKESGVARATIPPDNIMFNFLRPLRTIRITALIYGSPYPDRGWPIQQTTIIPPGTPVDPLATGRGSVGKVNSDTSWPTLSSSDPKGVGYWLLTRFSTSFAKYQGYYQLDAETTTRVHSAWSEYGTLRHMASGYYVPIDPSERASAVSATYSRGIHEYNGFVRVDPYYAAKFEDIFGF